MSQKLKLEDFLEDEIVAQEIKLPDKEIPISKKITEEINKFINIKNSKYDTDKEYNDFFNIIPKTRLEFAINKAINKSDESLEDKNRRSIFKANFDMKRRKINRIKSKSYRKVKRDLKKEQRLEEEENLVLETNCIDTNFAEQDDIEEDIEKFEAPIFSFNDVSNNQNHELVKAAFDDDIEENEEEFAKEKIEIINDEIPKTIEKILPGWGDWAGPGLEVKKTKLNTIMETRSGVGLNKRKDFGTSHVIINQKSDDIDDKYKSNLPYGYNKEEYLSKLNMPLSKELNTTRVYKKILKTVSQTKRGQHIEPFVYEPENL